MVVRGRMCRHAPTHAAQREKDDACLSQRASRNGLVIFTQQKKKQSEAYCGCQYCHYWVHNGFVNIDNEKMSKSLGNFRTLREACKDALDVRAFRFVRVCCVDIRVCVCVCV